MFQDNLQFKRHNDRSSAESATGSTQHKAKSKHTSFKNALLHINNVITFYHSTFLVLYSGDSTLHARHHYPS
eukprot:6491166-Amphidinium_carterae.3